MKSAVGAAIVADVLSASIELSLYQPLHVRNSFDHYNNSMRIREVK